MSESGDYEASNWQSGHDFKSVRASYDNNKSRGYDQVIAAGTKASDLVPGSITTKSGHPMCIDADFTGSMGDAPGVFVSKFPYFDHEVRTEYLGKDAEISFGAFCDTGDEYPLQIQAFGNGKEIKTSVEKLVQAGGGSGPGNICEAHGLPASYRLHNTHMPKAIIKPIYIIITDEMPYHLVTRDEAASFAKVSLKSDASVKKVFKELMEKYSMYLILRPYGNTKLQGDEMDSTTQRVYDCWEDILGSERIALLPESDRVVDVIFGILAQETDKVDYFEEELKGRQKPGQVKTVMKSLATIHALPSGAPKSVKKLSAGKSVLHTRKDKDDDNKGKTKKLV